MEYIGFDHVLVFDPAQSRGAAYDLRTAPSNGECDILHSPPVGPPSQFTDYVSLKAPKDSRLVRVGSETFVLMNGETGSYVIYECAGFRPFLAALPCKVSGLGQAPMFAGNVHLFASTPSRVLAYDEATGRVSLHFVDSDVSSANCFSRLAVGHNDNRLSTTLPSTSGPVSLLVLTDPGWLVVLHLGTREVNVYSYNSQAIRREDWIGDRLPVALTIPSWATHLVATSGSTFIAYSDVKDQFVSIRMISSGLDAHFSTSSTQLFFKGDGYTGFLSGHACLLDSRTECLQAPGCGWCVTNQKCVHAAVKVACDAIDCAEWCAEDSLDCLKRDEARKLVLGPRPVVVHPANLTSPKDVELGYVVAPAVLGTPDLDADKVATGTHFTAPENNSVNCMNAGVNHDNPEGSKGCNDNTDKQMARQAILSSIENMNSYKADLLVVKRQENAMPPQMPPDKDCVELDENGVPISLSDDAPLKPGDGDAPVPMSETGGRWGMQPALSVSVNDNTVTRDHAIAKSLIRKAHLPLKPMTERRMRHIQERLRGSDHFSPTSTSTVSGHEMMNNRRNKYTEVNARGDRLADGHATDQSELRMDGPTEVFVPPSGAPAHPPARVVVGEAQFNSVTFTKAQFEQQYSRLLTRALAAGAGVGVNEVQIGHVVSKDGNLLVDYTISTSFPDEVLQRLTTTLSAGDVQKEMASHGLEATIDTTPRVVSPDLIPEGVGSQTLSSSDMEGGCGDGDINVPISLSPNFMNGVALAEGHLPDDDGERVQGLLVGSLTEKGLAQMSEHDLIVLLNNYKISPPMNGAHVDRNVAYYLLHGIATPYVRTSSDTGRFATPMLWDGTRRRLYSPHEPEHVGVASWNDHLPVPPVTHYDLVKVDNSFQARSQDPSSPVSSIEQQPAVSHEHPEVVNSEVVPSPSMIREETVVYPNHPSLPEGGADLYGAADGTFNPIDLKVASNAMGLPTEVAALDSQLHDPYAIPPTPPSTANVWSASKVIRGTVVNDQLVPTSLLEVDQDTNEAHFYLAPSTTPATNTGIEVDPLVEYRNLDTEEDSDEGSLKRGCVSTEDPYTGNSQPRIDYLGNGQIIHVQPLIGVYGVYNLTSGVDTSTGELATPYRPVRRTYLGGPDNRLLEHFPLTGDFKFFKCTNAIFEQCTEYASGQWDKTVHPNDMTVLLSPHLVLLHNLDSGFWRIFNFDRDVSGAADPFSTSTPPIAAGFFPESADNEVVLLAPNTLLVNNPRTARARVFKFDPLQKKIVGPTHSGLLVPLNGVDPQRVTAVGDNHLVVYKPRSSIYRLYTCSEDPVGAISCNIERIGSLHASSGFEHNPTLTSLVSVDSVRTDSLAWAGESIAFIRNEKVGLVNGNADTVEASSPGEVPSQSFGVAGVVAVLPRPQFPDQILLVIDPALTASPAAIPILNHQLALLNTVTGVSTPITSDISQHHSSPRFSLDGTMLAFTGTSSLGPVNIFVSELRALLEHGAVPAVVKSYAVPVTLGPFSSDGRFLVIGVPTADILNDNNVDVLDIFNGHVAPLTHSSPDRQPSEWLVEEAVFHPLLPLLLVVTNHNAEHYGVQAITVHPHSPHDTPPAPYWLVSNDHDATFLSCDAFLTRCAVTFVNKGYADWLVYDLKLVDGLLVAEAISRPFFLTIKAAPNALRMSHDGTRVAVVKESPDAPGQIFFAKIVTTVRVMDPPGETGTVSVNATRLAHTRIPPPPEVTTKVSILQMVTSSLVPVPRSIDALPPHSQVTFPARDGLPINAFHFPPNLKPLLVDVLQPANRSIAAPLINGTRQMIKVNQTLSRRPAYVILLHDGPHQIAPPSLWRSPAHRALQALRALGIGVLVPNVRGSTGAGTIPALMASKEKRGNAIADVKAARDYICHRLVSDCDNIAVLGDGYGGLLALNALATYPEDFKAGVTVGGISNLVFHVSSPPLAPLGVLLQREYSADPAVQTKFSPLTHLDEIQAPVLVIHGTSDTEVSPLHAEAVVSHLSSNHRVVKYLSLHNDGHIISKAENKALTASSVAQFVLEHTGYLN